jgi:hypothetical protein
MPHTFKSKENWVKVDKAALPALINNGDININNLSTKNIDVVETEYYPQRKIQFFSWPTSTIMQPLGTLSPK